MNHTNTLLAVKKKLTALRFRMAYLTALETLGYLLPNAVAYVSLSVAEEYETLGSATYTIRRRQRTGILERVKCRKRLVRQFYLYLVSDFSLFQPDKKKRKLPY